eukprot:CAMPEP_0172895260 /NCGR_PEP_ID=MMETSP1075-20121228/152710_1 /TAXON_ID=2916 /ORGANISM="Ceratium fusus, Strain PA161109" /LENGTH=277 /DNA_ID=CAMNT_0013750451 /DNA_START=43 /DNA_END=872 /DNA_ORIENTATION=+
MIISTLGCCAAGLSLRSIRRNRQPGVGRAMPNMEAANVEGGNMDVTDRGHHAMPYLEAAYVDRGNMDNTDRGRHAMPYLEAAYGDRGNTDITDSGRHVMPYLDAAYVDRGNMVVCTDQLANTHGKGTDVQSHLSCDVCHANQTKEEVALEVKEAHVKEDATCRGSTSFPELSDCAAFVESELSWSVSSSSGPHVQISVDADSAKQATEPEAFEACSSFKSPLDKVPPCQGQLATCLSFKPQLNRSHVQPLACSSFELGSDSKCSTLDQPRASAAAAV